ncbi:MAG: HNH endonuclease [Promicromonosporaceae bacterium]|nr:HNH endonuclease [Promicromonosporaceae bacterium]
MGREVKYTYERLVEAAAHSFTISEVLRYLGESTAGGLHSHISKRLRELGVDTSHFTKGVRYRPELLREAVVNSTSVAGVLRYLGLTQAGGTHAYISRRIKELGIDTSHFVRYQGGAKQPGKVEAAQLLVCDFTLTRRHKPERLRRALIELGAAYCCAECGCDGIWRDKKLTLHIDHVNGDFRDNRADNLRFLCPNCHAQTPNFAGASKKINGSRSG